MMLAATEMIKLMEDPLKFQFFPDNPKTHKQNGCLAAQPTKSKGTMFSINNILYINDGVFLFATRDHLIRATQQLSKHFARFGLQMHVRNNETKSKMEAMLFPASISQATEAHDNVLESFKINDGENTIHFTRTLKYLGSLINMALNEDDEISHRIK